MASGSFDLTTYYAKRIIGDTNAASAATALLQAGVDDSMWIFGHNRNNYGIRYLYDSSTNGTADKIEFHGGHATNTTAWIQLDTGDASFGIIKDGTWNGSIIGVTYGGTGKNNAKDACNAFINALDTGDSVLTANDYMITQYVNGGTTTTTYHRRKASNIRVGGLTTGRTLKVSLGSTSASTAFDGTANITDIGVSGTLGVGNGGTGKTSWTKGGIIYASATDTLTQIADGSADKVLRSTASATYSWLSYTSSSTASTIVYRDASKNFSAGTITASLSGNATSASAIKSLGRQTSTDITHIQNGGLQFFLVDSNTITNKPAGDGFILHAHWDGAASNAWDAQLYIPDGHSGHMQFRGHSNATTWGSSWNTLLDTGNYSLYALPLSGGTITGQLLYKLSSVDASKTNNNISSPLYPTTFCVVDSADRVLCRLEGIIQSNGAIRSYWYVRNYNTSGTQTAQKGIYMEVDNEGNMTYNVSDASAFRTAISAAASGHNHDSTYLKLSGGTMTGDLKGSKTNILGATAIANHWYKLYLGGQTTNSNAINSATPLIEFSNVDRSQYCQLIYSDFDSVVAPDSLTLIGNQAGTHFIAPKINAGDYINNSYAMSTASFICNDWVRTKGATGWYNEDYGGGWYMPETDTTNHTGAYVKLYGNKQVVISSSHTTSTTNKSSQLIVSSVAYNSNLDTADASAVAIELWRGGNASWQIINDGGNLHFKNNWTTAKQTTYTQDSVTIAYNTGNTSIAGTLTAGGDISTTNGLLKSTKNSNTMTIGSQNTSYGHINNSANIPIAFNNTILTTAGNLGDTTFPWNNLYIGKSDGAGIYYTNGTTTTQMIRFLAGDSGGHGIQIGGGGAALFGSGESAGTVRTGLSLGGATEQVYITSDNGITFFANQQNGYNSAAKVTIESNKVWAGVNGNTTYEAQVGVQSGSGQMYMYVHASTTGSRGIYVPAHGSGSARSVFYVGTNNEVYFADGYNGTGTRLAYSQAGLAASDITWLTCWNGYELRAISKTEMAKAVQGAASGSWNINAATATNVAWTGITGMRSYQYDSNSDYSSYQWHQVIVSPAISAAYQDFTVTLLVTAGYDANRCGILTLRLRSNASSTIESQFAYWNTNSGIDPSWFVLCHKNSTKKTTLWCKIPAQYQGFKFAILEDGSRTVGGTSDWTLTSSVYGHGSANYDGDTVTASVSSVLNQKIHAPGTVTIINNTQNDGTYNALLYVEHKSGNDWGILVNKNEAYDYGIRVQCLSTGTSGISCIGRITGTKVYGAVWNDYAEYRKGEITDGGYCVHECPDGTMRKSTERLEAGCRVTSDTFGFAIGETEKSKTPIAVSGRVLVYPYRDKKEYKLGDAVCSAPDGKVDIMSRNEIIMYPERIIGTVSEIPNYDIWECGEGKDDKLNHRPVNGRIWIYVR